MFGKQNRTGVTRDIHTEPASIAIPEEWNRPLSIVAHRRSPHSHLTRMLKVSECQFKINEMKGHACDDAQRGIVDKLGGQPGAIPPPIEVCEHRGWLGRTKPPHEIRPLTWRKARIEVTRQSGTILLDRALKPPQRRLDAHGARRPRSSRPPECPGLRCWRESSALNEVFMFRSRYHQATSNDQRRGFAQGVDPVRGHAQRQHLVFLLRIGEVGRANSDRAAFARDPRGR